MQGCNDKHPMLHWDYPVLSPAAQDRDTVHIEMCGECGFVQVHKLFILS